PGGTRAHPFVPFRRPLKTPAGCYSREAPSADAAGGGARALRDPLPACPPFRYPIVACGLTAGTRGALVESADEPAGAGGAASIDDAGLAASRGARPAGRGGAAAGRPGPAFATLARSRDRAAEGLGGGGSGPAAPRAPPRAARPDRGTSRAS